MCTNCRDILRGVLVDVSSEATAPITKGNTARSATRVVLVAILALAGIWASVQQAKADAVSSAISWARGYLGSAKDSGLCLQFVHDAYANAGVDIGTASSAASYWQQNPKGWTEHPGDTSPPVGALVFWGATPSGPITYVNPDGHVGIYEGNNIVISTSAYPEASSKPNVFEFPLTGPGSRNAAGYPYLGWVAAAGASGSGAGTSPAGIAFEANTLSLWSAGNASVADRGLGMAAGTSPAITWVGNGYQIAFQANTGSLWTTGPLGTRDLGLGMARGSSPSIAAVSGGYEIAFQANTGDLWVAGSQGTADLGLGMAGGTSPAIASCNGSYGIAFQANTGGLWTAAGAGTTDRLLGMRSGTSPAIACGSNGYGIAFQANTGNLWTTGAAGTADRGLGMASGTSPAIASGAGGFGIAFQANTGNLWITGAPGTRDLGLGMMRGTSPAIAGGASWRFVFQANTGSLWAVGAGGTGDQRLGMFSASSPAAA